MTMTKTEIINHFGGAKQVAQFLDCFPSAVYTWGDEPPLRIQYELEVRTKGALRANIPTPGGYQYAPIQEGA
jgi:hypothetical protein